VKALDKAPLPKEQIKAVEQQGWQPEPDNDFEIPKWQWHQATPLEIARADSDAARSRFSQWLSPKKLVA
jgi:hypothetical protein